MTLKGKGVNLQVLTECICYLIFGGLLFYLTNSGEYLNYVTPRMKPYLYGMAFLMFLWAAVSGRYILTPQYRVRLLRSFVFIVPILLLAFRPPAPSGSSMVGAYHSSNLSAAVGNGGGQFAGGSGPQPSPPGGQFPPPLSTGAETKPEPTSTDSGETASTGDGGQTASSGDGGQTASSGDGGQTASTGDGGQTISSGDGGQTASSGNGGNQGNTTTPSAGENSAGYALNGLDTAAKTITIADDDYYDWMYELSSNYEKYIGYTVVIKGFIYRDPDVLKQGSFALVRLSMWCCSADLTPMGFIVKSDKKVDFKDDDWVTVKGTLGVSKDKKSIILEAQSIKAAEKPKQEYIYPYF